MTSRHNQKSSGEFHLVYKCLFEEGNFFTAFYNENNMSIAMVLVFPFKLCSLTL